MVLIGHRLTADEFRAVQENPESVEELLFGDFEDDDAEMPEPELDLDKAWHGIHFLLNGAAWTVGEGAGAAVLGGEEIGEDNGYGPARLLGPQAVQAIAAGLGALSVEALRARFDPQAMDAADIYPGIWDEGIEAFDTYLGPYFAQLREFYQAAAAGGQAVLLALT